MSSWNLFPRYSGRISFFWKGVTSCLPVLSSCVSHGINLGTETLFWKDRWLNGRAPMFIWPEEFRRTPYPNGSIRNLEFLLIEVPFSENEDVISFRDRVRAHVGDFGDKK